MSDCEPVDGYPARCTCPRCHRLAMALFKIWEEECAREPSGASFQTVMAMMRVAGSIAGAAAAPGREEHLIEGITTVFRERFQEGVRIQAEFDAKEATAQ